jgi:hypothetical protein
VLHEIFPPIFPMVLGFFLLSIFGAQKNPKKTPKKIIVNIVTIILAIEYIYNYPFCDANIKWITMDNGWITEKTPYDSMLCEAIWNYLYGVN